MRSSVVVALALTAAAAPAFAAPSNGYAKRETSSSLYARSSDDILMSREMQDLLARGFWHDFGEGFKKGFVGTIKTLAPIVPAFLKREDLELLARSGVLRREELEELMARGFWQDFGEGFKKGFVGTIKTLAPIVPAFLKREDLELLARDEELMARGFWHDFGEGFKKGFVGTIKTLAPIVPALLRRADFEDIMTRDDVLARGFWQDFGEGFKKGFVGTIKTLAPIVPAFLKREEIEMMAREAMIEHVSRDDIFERSPADKFAEGYKKAVLLTLRHLSPEAVHHIEPPHLDLLAHHAARNYARGDYDDLIARGFWSEVGDTLKQAGEAILPIVPDLVKAYRGKREFGSAELELLARGDYDALMARGFWHEVGDTLKQAGQAILPIMPDLIKAYRGKRGLESPELEFLARQYEARSINDLD